jgi:hypothetical protein
MTPEEINALVAEKVMGWKLKDGFWYNQQGWSDWTKDDACYDTPIFNPCGDIKAAMFLIEKLMSDGTINEMTITHDYGCTLIKYTGGRLRGSTDEFEAFSETLPMAIALAALKTVGVEVNES